MKAVPLIGIARHRLTIDGEGITTLVAFHGCPLRCKYCLNPTSLQPDGVWERYDCNQLYEEVRKDELYFLASCGGVTFGGGEPLLQNEFIYTVLAMAAVILVGTILSFTTYMEGVRLIGASKASLFASVEPVTATFMTVVFMGAAFQFVDFIGLAGILGAVLMLSLLKKE